MSFASLGMYDWPEVQCETDQLWHAIRDSLRGLDLAAPDELDRESGVWEVWQSPDLILSQTCGLPYAAKLSGEVSLLGAPVYDLIDCPRGTYRSEIIVAADEMATEIAQLRGRRFAYNSRDSQSGWACFATQIEGPDSFFGDLVQSGGHRDSVREVAEDRADAACIDAVSWQLAKRHDPELTARVRVIERTALTPGLPFITATRDEATLARMRLVIETAIETLPDTVKDALFLKGFAKKRPSDYAPLAIGWPEG